MVQIKAAEKDDLQHGGVGRGPALARQAGLRVDSHRAHAPLLPYLGRRGLRAPPRYSHCAVNFMQITELCSNFYADYQIA